MVVDIYLKGNTRGRMGGGWWILLLCIGTVVSCWICWDEGEVWMETRKRAELMLTGIRGRWDRGGNGWIGWTSRTTESTSLIGNRKRHVAASFRDVINVRHHNLVASSAHYYLVQTSSWHNNRRAAGAVSRLLVYIYSVFHTENQSRCTEQEVSCHTT